MYVCRMLRLAADLFTHTTYQIESKAGYSYADKIDDSFHNSVVLSVTFDKLRSRVVYLNFKELLYIIDFKLLHESRYYNISRMAACCMYVVA